MMRELPYTASSWDILGERDLGPRKSLGRWGCTTQYIPPLGSVRIQYHPGIVRGEPNPDPVDAGRVPNPLAEFPCRPLPDPGGGGDADHTDCCSCCSNKTQRFFIIMRRLDTIILLSIDIILIVIIMQGSLLVVIYLE